MAKNDFYRAHEFGSIKKVNDVDRERGIRIYCEQSARTWNLQVRGPLELGNGREGKDFIVATASLGVEELLALRKAIDNNLAEAAEYDEGIRARLQEQG